MKHRWVTRPSGLSRCARCGLLRKPATGKHGGPANDYYHPDEGHELRVTRTVPRCPYVLDPERVRAALDTAGG